MASTITLASTVAWAQTFTRYQPLTVGANNEPAITNANVIKQTIVGPPFIWNWNRASDSSTSTAAGTQDYTIALAAWGFVEKVTVTDATGVVTELEIKQVISADSAGTLNRARPNFVSVQTDDDAGNITFRLMPVPDAIYALTVVYQKSPALFTTTAALWSPIPDKYQYIYSRGFLALAMSLVDDARFTVEHTRFLASLLGASEGLSETEKSIFMGNALGNNAQMQAGQIRTQQAAQARGT